VELKFEEVFDNVPGKVLRVLRNTDHHHRFRVEKLIHFFGSSYREKIYTGENRFSTKKGVSLAEDEYENKMIDNRRGTE
jgi:hypothetical protein